MQVTSSVLTAIAAHCTVLSYNINKSSQLPSAETHMLHTLSKTL